MIQNPNDLLKEQHERLSPQLQKAARFVIDHNDDVALKPIREIAETSGVTTNVLVRLAKELGFEGYAAFRERFQISLRQAPSKIIQGEKLSDFSHEIEEQAVFNIRQTLNDNDDDLINEAVETIDRAENIYIMGLRSCYPVAYSFYYAYAMFKDNACLIEGHAGTMGDQLRRIGPSDVFFVISTNPFSRDAVMAAKFAAQKGAKVITMLDQDISPFDDLLDIALKCSTRSKTLFASTTAMMTLSEILMSALLQKSGNEAMKTMKKTQEQLTDFNAYWTD